MSSGATLQQKTSGFAVMSGSCLTIASSSHAKLILLTGKPLSSYSNTFSQTYYSLAANLYLDFFFEQTSISAKINSVCTFSISAIGSRFVTSSTCITSTSSKHLTKCTIELTDLILARNWLPRPAPYEAPLIKPAISHISIWAGTTFCGLAALVKFLMFLSFTATLATFGSIVQKG